MVSGFGGSDEVKSIAAAVVEAVLRVEATRKLSFWRRAEPVSTKDEASEKHPEIFLLPVPNRVLALLRQWILRNVRQPHPVRVIGR